MRILAVKNLMVRAGADFSGIKKEMDKAQKNLRDFKSNISSTMKAIGGALATIGIGVLVKDAAKVAMGVEASMQQINRTMGSSAAAFKDWANEGAKAFGMGRADALRYGSIYSNLLSTFTKDTAETFRFTQDLLKASAIVASGTGRNIEDVMWRIRSGLLGNTEAIEDLGINVYVNMLKSTEAFKRFAGNKSWDQLDFKTQQAIRYFGILEQATMKYGTALNQNTNTRQMQFVAQLKDIQLSLGNFVLPIYNAVLPALTAMAAAVSRVMSVLAQFSQALFGKAETKAQTDGTSQQAAAVAGLGDAYEAAGKQAKGSVAGFDEVNTLGEGSGGAGAGAGGSAVSAMDSTSTGEETSSIADKVKEMAERVKAAFTSMKDVIVQNKDLIIAALAGLAAGFTTYLVATNWPLIIGAISTAFKGLRTAIWTTWAALTGPIGLIAIGVAALVAAFVYFYRTNETFRGVVDGILKKIGEAAMWLWNEVLVPLGAFLKDVFIVAWEGVTVAAEWLWKNVLVPIGNFMIWLWHNVISPLAGILGDVLAIAFETVADIAKSFWKNVLVPLGNFFAEIFGPAVEALSAVFGFLWNDVLVPFGTFLGDIFKPIWKALTDVIVYLWDTVLEPLVKFLASRFASTFDTVFKGIGEIIDGVKTTLIGVMTFITGVFTGDWEKAWNGVKDIFAGVFGTLYDIVKIPLNLIIDSINAVISALNSISIDIPDWVPNFGGKKFGINIPKIPHLAKGGITNGPMMAMIGDNPGGKEVVSPLGDLMDMMQSAVSTAVLTAMNFNNSGDKELVIQIDGKTIARALSPFTSSESSRIGGSMITVR